MKEIGRVRKAKNKFIVISEDKFKAMEMVDVRECLDFPNKLIYTNRGIKLKRELVEELIKILGETI